MFSIIVAIAQNHAIGKDNKLLWHLPEDLKRFKRITTGHPVIMGKKTYESLPIKPLPNRTNIVISDNPADRFNGCVTVHSMDDLKQFCNDPQEEYFIIGGASIYRQFLDLSDRIYLTTVHKDFEGDVFFPEFDRDQWIVEEEEHFQVSETNPLPNTFSILKRKNEK
ncbi:MAG: dihydrofolate reductase [Bacteroidetes bacterium]|nr:dihydrofolate reductase [Bacteroidota bacterium]